MKSVVLVLECSMILPSAGGAAAVHLRPGEELPDEGYKVEEVEVEVCDDKFSTHKLS